MAIEKWAVEYEKRETMEFAGGTIIPKAQIVEVRGSEKVNRPNPFCDIFIDVRIVHGKNPNAIKQEIAATIKRLNLGCEGPLFQDSRGFSARHVEPLIV